MVPGDITNLERWVEQDFPTDKPNWDYNTEKRRIQLDRNKTAIIQRLKKGACKSMDMSKPVEIVQKESESPSEFYERLCKAYRLYTPIDPKAMDSPIVIN